MERMIAMKRVRVIRRRKLRGFFALSEETKDDIETVFTILMFMALIWCGAAMFS